MYGRLSAVMFPIVTVLLGGALLWGYQVNQEKNSILIKAENQYQRAFHDLSYHLEKLQGELGKTLALHSSSTASQRKGLINIWRLTSQAQGEINQLPLTLLPFNQTEEFLSNVANFAYQTAMRDLTKEPLTQDEMKTLKALYQHSKEITGSIRDVQTKVIANGLRWMDVETALATEQNMLDNTIIDGFQTVNKKVSEYDDLNFGESVVGAADKKSFRALAGNDVSVDEIKQKAAQWAGIQDVSAVQVVENGDGADRSVYSVTVKKPGSDHEIAMDFSKKGGQLIWFMISRPVGGKTKGMEEATQIARTYLDGHGYRDMTPVNYEEYQNTASIAFAGKSGDVIVYPDLVTVNVALDNGEVVGMNAADYLLKHQTRNLKKPALTMEQARKSLHPEFQIADQATALIENETGKEVLCYQFTGKVNGSVYRIYINADNGTEEKVEEMRELPAPARS